MSNLLSPNDVSVILDTPDALAPDAQAHKEEK